MAQSGSSLPAEHSPQPQASSSPSASLASEALPPGSPAPTLSLPPQLLFDVRDSDIKFNLTTLMSTLRDSRHEGWVLAAYPDPKTSRPLIGAGFSLDVAATEHIQRDSLNPYPFLEPSSAQLWRAAGLEDARLQAILDQYDSNLKKWKKKNYRRKIRAHQLQPEITSEEANSLLRISTLQAVHNARAYCRNFDQLTASQQMALSQLVYQMGVNLEEFVEFLTAMNDGYPDASQPESSTLDAQEHWKAVQRTLIQSQWARRYTSRAVTVIAMFDPGYSQDPKEAEHEVRAQLHPPATHHRKKQHATPA